MAEMMSACGVLCSECPAYFGDVWGIVQQQRTAQAWSRIYGYNQPAESIACRGCLGPEDQVFHTCRTCEARNCCRAKGFSSCAECPVEQCPDLEKAQSVWDGVPEIAKILSHDDFVIYAQPYCGHRERLAEARRAVGRRTQ